VEFKVRSRTTASGAQILDLEGDLDLGTAPVLARALDGLFNEGCRRLAVNLDRAGYIDSTGISLLLKTWHRLAEDSGQLAVVCTAPGICRTLRIINLSDTIPVVDTEDQALALLGD
jgi:anti-sigma B factor antagonist